MDELSIGKRAKIIREKNDLSLSQFAETIGLTKSAYVNFEYDRNKRSSSNEPTIKAICMKYGVREEWLRSGSGDMYEDPTGENAAVRLMMEALSGGNSFKKKVLMLLCQLDESEWDKIEAFARMLIEEEGTSE